MTESDREAHTVGVDTGGTFTDFVFVDRDGNVRIDKRPSNRDRPEAPVIEGLRDAAAAGSLERVIHGTTVATNALLEGKTARCALITTEGFEDVLEIGRQNRPQLYALHPRLDPPLIPRELRFGVKERVLHTGAVETALTDEEIDRVLDLIEASGTRTVAVCLLHSYANVDHEQRVGRRARARGLTVSLSSEVLPEFREYERASTTVVNASLRPIMGGYLERLERGPAGDRLSIMQSAGGIIPSAIAARLPVHTVLSGPAGGVIAAAETARLVGLERIITFDMGGTSTDVSLFDRGPTLTSEKIIGGRSIRVPVIDIHTVGAGGGSIADRDTGGSLKVGPESAGADPGPVCYGKGRDITVTDADLALGRLRPEYFLGGRMTIDPTLTAAPLDALARSLGMDRIAAAEGVIAVINAVMERAVRVISIERGHDPHDFTLVSFGGAGGMHAVELAAALGIPRVLVPKDAGVFSAYGMALADVTRDLSRTILTDAVEVSTETLEERFSELISTGCAELAREGIPPEALTSERWLDMRYRGQSYELTVPLTRDPVQAFHEAHTARFGYAKEGSRVEIVNVRARLIATTKRPDPRPSTETVSDPKPAEIGRCSLIYDGTSYDAPAYDRSLLAAGASPSGPCLIVESTSTTFLPPGSSARIDGFANLLISVG